MLMTLPSFGHIIGFGAIALLVLFWGIREKRQYPNEKFNSTLILGTILVILSAVYYFYSEGLYFGMVYLVLSIIIAKLLKDFN